MATMTLTPTEIGHRKEIACQAFELIKRNLPIESADEQCLITTYRNFYLQISISDVHPLIVFCFVRAVPKEDYFPFHKINEMNLACLYGCHCLDADAQCYAYRAIHWLDCELSMERLMEILDRCAEEAMRGYEKLCD